MKIEHNPHPNTVKQVAMQYCENSVKMLCDPIPDICRQRHQRHWCNDFKVRGIFFPYLKRKEPLWNIVEYVLFDT